MKTKAGDLVFAEAAVRMTDESTEKAYTSRPPWYGDLSQDGANLMRDEVQPGQECVLEFDGNVIARARIASLDMEHKQVQIVGLEPWPFQIRDNQPTSPSMTRRWVRPWRTPAAAASRASFANALLRRPEVESGDTGGAEPANNLFSDE